MSSDGAHATGTSQGGSTSWGLESPTPPYPGVPGSPFGFLSSVSSYAPQVALAERPPTPVLIGQLSGRGAPWEPKLCRELHGAQPGAGCGTAGA